MSERDSLIPFSFTAAREAACDTPEWLPVKTSDYRLRGLRDRHYAGGVGGATVGPPGRRIAFVTFEGTAGWVSRWGKPEFIDHAFGEAYECTLFRKECPGLASAMIEAAIRLTELRWGPPPPGGWLTFVEPAKVASPNPGYCFKCAGFKPVGFTKDRGLLVLRREVTPHREARSGSTEPGHRRELTVAAERQGQSRTGRVEGRVAA